jgi:hypothetical protein
MGVIHSGRDPDAQLDRRMRMKKDNEGERNRHMDCQRRKLWYGYSSTIQAVLSGLIRLRMGKLASLRRQGFGISESRRK